MKTWLQVAAIGFSLGAFFSSVAAQTPTSTTLAVTLNGSTVTAVDPGSVISLTATVMSGSTPVTPGQVKFCDASVSWCTDIHLLGLAQLTGSGTATLKFVPGIGVHRIKAVFLGTNADAASSSAVSTLTVVGTRLPWSFAFPYNFVVVPTEPAPQADVIADFNGDGKPDLAVAIGNAAAPASSVDVFLGNGDGTFYAAPAVPSTNAKAGSIIAGDFDGDGKQDLAVVLPDVSQIQVLLGNGDGTFTLGQNISDSSKPSSIVTGDFNRDGIADLAVVDPGGNNLIILLGKGDGTFTQAAQSPTFSASPVSAAVGDFNGDGKADLAVVLDGASIADRGSVTILLGNGNGTFTPVEQTLATAPSPASIAAFDFTGNGILDLAVASLDAPPFNDAFIDLFLGKGNGTFKSTNYEGDSISPFSYNSVTFGELQNAGDADLFFAAANGVFSYLSQQNNGLFNYASEGWGGTADSPFVAVGDLNGDGFADIAAVLNSANSVIVYTSAIYGTSTEAATTTTLTAVPTNLTVGQTLTLTATVTASHGATPAGTVFFLNGIFILGAANLNSNGVATLSLSPAAGAYSITASYGGSSTDAPSVSVPPIAVNVGSLVSTSTSLQASATIFRLGQTVTLTATVIAAGGGTPGGPVTFFNGAAPLGTGMLNAQGVATIQTALLPPGANSITAAYPGSGEFAASTSPALVVNINAYAATTTELAIASGGNPVSAIIQGNSVQLTATVTSTFGAVTPGQVNFCDAAVSYCTDIHLLGTAQLSPSGTATVSFIPAIGNHSYKAVFPGTISDKPSSSSPATLNVTPPVLYPTTTVLTPSGNPGDYNLTATVTGDHPLAPTGTITFVDTSNANYLLGTAPLGPLGASFALNFFESANIPGSNTVQMTAVDFNGDGKRDLALMPNSLAQPAPGILLGNGDGTFQLAAPTMQFATAEISATGDFDEDGKPDLVTVANGGPATVMLGNGDGTFTPLTPIEFQAPPGAPTPFGATGVAVGDFNGDGHADLALTTLSGPFRAQIVILFGSGDGTFQAGPTLYPSNTSLAPGGIIAADFNNDGKMDLAVIDQNLQEVAVFLGHGDGKFTEVTPSAPLGPQGQIQTTTFATGDFNGDGNLDLAVMNFDVSGPGTVSILLGNGDGTFSPAPVVTVTYNTKDLALGDFNADGKLDLVTVYPGALTGTNNQPGWFQVMQGNGDGSFAAPLTVPTGAYPSGAIAAVDFNNDGASDVALYQFTPPSGGALDEFLSQQAGTITASAAVTGISIVGTGTHMVEAIYSGDSFYAGSTSQPILLSSQQVPTTLSLITNLTAINQGQPVLLTATLSPNQAQNHAPSGVITFYSGTTAVGTAPLNSSGVAALNATDLPPGVDSVTAQYAGDMNFAASNSNAVTITVTGVTTTTLAAAPTALILGQTLTLTATVAATGATPAGTVTFFNGAAPLGTATLDTNGIAAFQTNALPVGVFTLTASYAATAGFAASTSAPVSVSIASPTSTTLNAVPTSLTLGQTLTLIATVTASSGSSPTGTVNFLNGMASLGTATLNANGVATLNLTPGVGDYSITAGYAGTLTDAPSASSPPSAVTVNRIATSTALDASPTTLFLGQTLTLTVTVTASGGATPAGTVTFLNNGATLGSASLNANGVAALTLTPAIGNYSITASYGGSSTDAPSVSSPPVQVKVATIPTTIVLGASPLSLTVTQTLTLTAVVSATGPTPAGTVTFNNANPVTGVVQALGQVPLNTSGSATLTFTPAVGSYVISATYGGSAFDSPSTSPQVNVVVNPATTTTLLTASPNPANFGQMVALSATVTSAIGTPTGTFNFYDGTTLLGSKPVASGAATFSTGGLSLGNHSLTAVYSGATNFFTSTSGAVGEIITVPNFSISISPSSQSVYSGESATYTVAFTQAEGLNLGVALSCSQLPVNTTCTLSQGVLSESGTSTLTVRTTAPKAGSSASVARAGAGAALACLFLFFVPRRRRKAPLLFLIVAALFVSGTVLGGCSGPLTLAGGTPVGPQTITVSATMTVGSQQFTKNAIATLNVKSLF